MDKKATNVTLPFYSVQKIRDIPGSFRETITFINEDDHPTLLPNSFDLFYEYDPSLRRIRLKLGTY